MTEIILIITGILALLYFSYSAGKDSEKVDTQEDYIDAIKSAKEARNKLARPEYVEWLRKQRRK